MVSVTTVRAGVPDKKKSRNGDPGVRVQVIVSVNMTFPQHNAKWTVPAGRKDILQQDWNDLPSGDWPVL